MYRGIDVSYAQGEIDWNAVKESGIEAAIIRAGYGNDISQEDGFFRKNIQGAKDAGLNVGIYWFCYARDTQDARAEANACYEVIKEFSLDYPIFYDFEEDTVRYMKREGADISKCSDNITAFCEAMNEKGYLTGIYSNPNCIQNHLNENVKKYPLWLAEWPQSPNLQQKKEYEGFSVVIWQYADHQDGSIGGIGNVDCDMFYIEISEEKKNSTPMTLLYQEGDTVSFSSVFYTSSSEEALQPAIDSGVITKIIEGARNPYLINDGTGWINDSVILNSDIPQDSSESEVEDSQTFTVGAQVRVRDNATDINGTGLADFVYQNIYCILAEKEGRYLIGNEQGATAWMSGEDIYLL